MKRFVVAMLLALLTVTMVVSAASAADIKPWSPNTAGADIKPWSP